MLTIVRSRHLTSKFTFNSKDNFKLYKTFLKTQFYKNLLHMETGTVGDNVQLITEGLATVKTAGKVFYNPVQEFNRDLR